MVRLDDGYASSLKDIHHHVIYTMDKNGYAMVQSQATSGRKTPQKQVNPACAGSKPCLRGKPATMLLKIPSSLYLIVRLFNAS